MGVLSDFRLAFEGEASNIAPGLNFSWFLPEKFSQIPRNFVAPPVRRGAPMHPRMLDTVAMKSQLLEPTFRRGILAGAARPGLPRCAPL